jgi:hypothetical protein
VERTRGCIAARVIVSAACWCMAVVPVSAVSYGVGSIAKRRKEGYHVNLRSPHLYAETWIGG